MSFLETVKERVANLKTLEIRTVVGHFKWDEAQRKIVYKDDEVKLIMTQIDLLEGDITTSFSEEFLQPPYDEIRKYHAEREKQGHAIIEGNLKALKGLIELIRDVSTREGR
jgi:hypothetical protein